MSDMLLWAPGGRAMKPFTLMAAAIFMLMAAVHLYRLVVPFPVIVGGVNIGQDISWIALAVTAALTVGLFREGMR